MCARHCPLNSLDAGGNKIHHQSSLLSLGYRPPLACIQEKTAALPPIFNNISCPICIIKNVDIPLKEKQPHSPQFFSEHGAKPCTGRTVSSNYPTTITPFSSLHELVQHVCRLAWTLSLQEDHYPLCLQCGPARQGAAGSCHSSVLILKPA